MMFWLARRLLTKATGATLQQWPQFVTNAATHPLLWHHLTMVMVMMMMMLVWIVVEGPGAISSTPPGERVTVSAATAGGCVMLRMI